VKADGGRASIGHDPDAFELFYRAHVEAVGRFVARRVDDPQAAADLTADVFLAAIESARGYRSDRGSEVGWLFGVARNVIAAEQRRWHRRRRAASEVAGQRQQLLLARPVRRLGEAPRAGADRCAVRQCRRRSRPAGGAGQCPLVLGWHRSAGR
jgi:DNA-directed RNA polymerase specialized sigma24 family protein